MKTGIKLIILFLMVLIMRSPTIKSQLSIVEVEGGKVEGVIEDGIAVFRGIPFAAPPVGEFRWRAPQPVAEWDSILKADKFAPACPQMQFTFPGAHEMEFSEDCLYLNVWTPSQSSDEKLPVMVWIYGGGFAMGSTSIPLYSGEQLAKIGVIVVSIAYRVGALGFLAHPELSAESENNVSGNYGLLDQIAGLKWVKKNIKAFGGDPERVTIFGESAGGISVSILAASPLASGLFSGAISQSGGSFEPVRFNKESDCIQLLEGAEAYGVEFAKHMDANSIAELREIEPEKWLEDSMARMGSFWPIVDGYVISGDQYKLYEAGEYNDANVIIGTNSDEGAIFTRPIEPEQYVEGIRIRFGPFADRILELYPGNTKEEATTSSADIFRETAFAWPSWSWARLQSKTGKSNVFVYYFDQQQTSSLFSAFKPRGAGHGAEIPYIFKHLDQNPERQYTDDDRRLSEMMAKYWTNFARNGNPNGEGLPEWPVFKENKQTVIYLNGTPKSGPVPNLDKLKLMEEYFSWKRKAGSEGQQLFIGDDIAIAETKYGKVQGFLLRNIYNFRGIPYGDNTGGKNRFMPPREPEAWEGVYPAIWWGNSAPQIMDNRYSNAYSSFTDHWNYDDVSEDCLKLNIWTPGIADGKKRPVLVWLHGGGYINGNGIEQDGYNGENLSRKGDIVFCSINHRLGPLGFSDLSAVGGEKYASSGNAGALDMVAALQWVKENIANFGGDPGNVTIIGQSGGGAKVCVLATMPKVKGLFHKAVALSGSTIEAKDQKDSRKVGQYILEEAGLSPSELDKLQEMPWKDYVLLANKANNRWAEENGITDFFLGGFGPVSDSINIPAGKFFTEADGLSSDIPMLISSTFHEWALSRDMPELEYITEEKAKEALKERVGFRLGLGEKAGEVYEAYAKVFPTAKPIEIMTLIASNRKGVVETANAKSNQKAPVYVAWFGWESPLFDKRVRAFHCLDICFWFYNTDLMLTHTGGGKRPRMLSEKMADALIRFMKTGNPNGEGLPEWPEYTQEDGETMILNDIPEVKNDPDREARILLD
jgi:para-nitrobenzyl esterase